MMLYVLTVLTVLSLLLHLPAVERRIKASKNTLDDKLLEGVDKAKDLLEEH